MESEADRIRREYERRDREIHEDYYSLVNPSVLYIYQQRVRAVIAALKKAGIFPLDKKKILEIGCGKGDWLNDFEAWGAHRENLSGIELDASRGKRALARYPPHRDEDGNLISPGADIRIGDASLLPWPDAFFDLVLQSTVLTSILDQGMKTAIAGEMSRVLKPGGFVLWYDFFYDNPKNPNVKGVGKEEINALFPGYAIQLKRITLAPPVSRHLVPLSWIGTEILEKMVFLNTHYLGVLRKPGNAG
jgi:SAM-dependent methyltransferase